MNLLLLKPAEVEGDDLVLTGARASHIRQVLRAVPGQKIRVGAVRRSMGTAVVASISDDRVILNDFKMSSPGLSPRVRLVIALPRPKALRRLLQTAACFQVTHVDVVNAWRVQKSYWDSPLLELDAMEREMWTGCEQGRHPWLPTLACHRLFVRFFEAEAAANTHHVNGCSQGPRFLAHPGASDWLRDVPATDHGSIATFAIGPEGGWIERELASFDVLGYRRISVSNSILRSEIALAATLAQWEMRTVAFPAEG